MAETNYGVVLKKGASSIGSLTNIDFPKVSTESVEVTHHASNGLREYIPSGLIQFETFTATILGDQTAFEAIKSDIDAGTYATYTIDYTTGTGVTDWSFSCSPISIALNTADATSPEALTMTVEFQISGDVTGF